MGLSKTVDDLILVNFERVTVFVASRLAMPGVVCKIGRKNVGGLEAPVVFEASSKALGGGGRGAPAMFGAAPMAGGEVIVGEGGACPAEISTFHRLIAGPSLLSSKIQQSNSHNSHNNHNKDGQKDNEHRRTRRFGRNNAYHSGMHGILMSLSRMMKDR